jgi:DNA (cytosine-5)-methyltransferase 1
MGGIRLGLEQAAAELGLTTECVFASDIKQAAQKVFAQNHPSEQLFGDVTQIKSKDIPDFDIMLAGYPCQSYSAAGKRLGFEDTRGTLFFDVARILKEKQPNGFIFENVEGLVVHDKQNPKDKIGKTLQTMLNVLEDFGYKVTWKVLNSKEFGVAQERKRIYIVGCKKEQISLDNFDKKAVLLKDILESGLPTVSTPFSQLLLKNYTPQKLIGKSIKDKRGGKNNIHSWDIGYKGELSKEQKQLMNMIMTERRKKKWAEEYGIDWMDGMPLTYQQIATFAAFANLKDMLDDLVLKGYLKMEHPKKKVGKLRVQDETLPIGYNIVAGKMSFEIGTILDPESITPTLVATDMDRLYVVDGIGLRRLSKIEGLRLFGYPDDYKLDVSEKEYFDLLGNTVVVPVIKEIALRLLLSRTN